MITIGSLFSGIGGFELGLERAIPNSKTIWQVEREPFCQQVLRKHWPDAVVYDDITTIDKSTLPSVDILCGGYPCQDLSVAGKRRGIHDGKKSSLYWEMWEIICAIRPRVVVMENVASHITMGFGDVLGSLAKIGYNAEWTILSAQQYGAPHLRQRLFIVAYPGGESDSGRPSTNADQNGVRTSDPVLPRGSTIDVHAEKRTPPNSNSFGLLQTRNWNTIEVDGDRQKVQQRRSQKPLNSHSPLHQSGIGYWEKNSAPSPFCGVDDGIPNRVDRIRALGNAIVPQCSEWIGKQIYQSILLDDVK